MYNGQQGVGQNKFNQLVNRFQPPPNPYQNHKAAGGGMYNRGNFMMQQQGYPPPQYNDYNNRYNEHMYDNEAISDDSSDGMHDDPNAENEEAEDPEVNLGSYQSNAANMFGSSANNLFGSYRSAGNIGGHQMDRMLPEIPAIPPMAQFPDVNMKAEEDELNRHVGFVIKLNARLVQLNAECRELYPQLGQDLIDSKLKEFQQKEYVSLIEEKVALERKCNEYEQQMQHLIPVENVKKDLESENKKLRELTESYAEKVESAGNISQKDYREMISNESREYVNEIQTQLDAYREQVIRLSQQSQNCMRAIQNSVQHQKTTQESIQNAYNELKPLGEHLAFLEENLNNQQNAANNDESNKKLQGEIESLEEKLQRLDFKNKALQNEMDILKQTNKNVQSEKLANKAQVEQHLEFKYKEQINQLQDDLSKNMIDRLEMEEKFQQKQKDEQERADKYRAKYESVKQHVKTLEMQKVEYTRVNMQLRQQNNEFRQMITTLQNQLKMISMQQQQQQQQQQQHEQQPPLLSQQQQRLMQLQQQQQNLMRQQNLLNNKHHQHSHSVNQVGAGNNAGAAKHQHANSYDPNQMQMMQMQAQMDGNQHRKLWGKSTKELSEKGTKKRVLIEWHFVTSDAQPHTVVLQHTQDTKPKTRRMLWVDGVEKYNNKSSASSFRIEIDKDVVVVSIDQLDQYQYRLTINNASYQDAFKLWESRQKR